MPEGFRNVLDCTPANFAILPIPPLARQPAALPAPLPGPAAAPPHAGQRFPNLLNPARQQPIRNTVAALESDGLEEADDLEVKIGNGRAHNRFQAFEFKETSEAVTILSKWLSESSMKALLGLSLRNAGEYPGWVERSGSIVASDFSRSLAQSDSQDAEFLLVAPDRDSGR